MSNLEKYREAVKQGVVAACDFAASLSDTEAKEVFDAASKDSDLKSKLVRPLWYNYDTQSFRF
jgi:aminoglycoside phosphotransferase